MKHWYCIHTKPAREDTICKLLAPFPAIELFNPLIRRKKRIRATYRHVTERLFPSYLFARLELPRYMHTIQNTRGVRRMVGDHTTAPWIVDDDIIDLIRSRTVNECWDAATMDFTAGETLQITDGPLMGLTGIFLYEINASDRVVILLNTIQNQARVQIERHQLGRL